MVSNLTLTFSQFQHFLAEVLGVDVGELKPERSFLDDLGIESLKLVEMILSFETELGVAVPTEAAWEMQTVGAAYDGYLAIVQDQAGEAQGAL
jgi:acyl carrier protein